MMSDFRRRNQSIVFYNPCISVAETLRGVSLEEFVVIYTEPELHQYIIRKISPIDPIAAVVTSTTVEMAFLEAFEIIKNL